MCCASDLFDKIPGLPQWGQQLSPEEGMLANERAETGEAAKNNMAKRIFSAAATADMGSPVWLGNARLGQGRAHNLKGSH